VHHGATQRTTVQNSATRCNAVPHTTTHRNAAQRSTTHSNTLQRTATNRNTPQHTTTHCNNTSICQMLYPFSDTTHFFFCDMADLIVTNATHMHSISNFQHITDAVKPHTVTNTVIRKCTNLHTNMHTHMQNTMGKKWRPYFSVDSELPLAVDVCPLPGCFSVFECSRADCR